MAYDKKQTEHAHAGHEAHGAEHFREKHLMLDPLPRGQKIGRASCRERV